MGSGRIEMKSWGKMLLAVLAGLVVAIPLVPAAAHLGGHLAVKGREPP